MDTKKLIFSGDTAATILRGVYEAGSEGVPSDWAIAAGLRVTREGGLTGSPEVSGSSVCIDHTTSSLLETRELLARAPVPTELLGEMPELLYGEARRRPRQGCVASRTWSTALPEGAFIPISPEVLVCSPAFLLVLRAPELGLISTMSFGNELCGRYSLDRSLRGMNDHPAFTTPAAMRDFLAGCWRGKGTAMAATAVKWIRPGFRSPMESSMFLLEVLPRCYGGYGLRHEPEVNGRVIVPDDLLFLSGVPSYEVDQLWRGQGVVVEYDGEVHADPRQRVRDDTKTHVLQEMGYKVLRISWDIVHDVREFDCRMRVLGEHLGEPVPPCTREFELRRRRLRETLLHGSW